MAVSLLDPSHAHPFARRPGQDDLLALCVLREIDAAGPLNGLDAANRVAPLVRFLRATPPTCIVLHDLVDDGLLAATPGMPPNYRITDAGRLEAELLAERFWPSISRALSHMSDRLAPERGRDLGFVTPWADERRARERRPDEPRAGERRVVERRAEVEPERAPPPIGR